MVWSVELCSFVNLTTKPEGLTSAKSLILLPKTFKFCGARMQFKSCDEMLGLGANIHQNLCLLKFLFTASFKLHIKFYTTNGNSGIRSISGKLNKGSLYRINIFFFFKNFNLCIKFAYVQIVRHKITMWHQCHSRSFDLLPTVLQNMYSVGT